MTETFDPDEALAIVNEARERLVARNPSPAWYAPIYGLLSGVLVAGGGLPEPIGIVLIVVSTVGLALLYRTWSDKAGISLSGYRPGRTRTIAIGLVILLIALMLAGLALRTGFGLEWAPIAFGAIAAVAAAWASSLWDRAWRAQVTGRPQ